MCTGLDQYWNTRYHYGKDSGANIHPNQCDTEIHYSQENRYTDQAGGSTHGQQLNKKEERKKKVSVT